ncbi:hypothetical protein EMPS_06536 [Entomortierella parvispora]|uniref:Uncharacterized protein n=1 Tax=Entomortierella parvispora TaxID=205924 RepID=A0A9P3HD69_9FUNG|nr:hypothetical protein EMPS_06536 [Entomortierella parvispora]
MTATSWTWQTPTLTQPSLLPSPPPPPTGSSGDSGGAPGSGGSNGSNGSSTNPNDSSSGSKTGLGKGAIIAIAIVAALLLILIPILILWWCRRKRQNDKKYEERTEELKKSIVMDQGGGKRMGSSLPLPRAIPQVPPRHSPVTFYLETPGATPALGGMTLIGHDRSSHSGSSSMPGSSTMSYDERLSVHPSHPSMQSLPSIQSPTMQSPLQMQAQPSIQSLPHPYQQPSRTWSQDGGSVANGGSPSPRTLNPSPRTLNQQHQHSFSDNESTAGPGSVDGYHSDARLSRGGIYDDKHEIMSPDRDPYGHHERSTTSMSYLKSPALTELEHPRSTTTMSYMKSPALTDLEPPMPLMSPMYSPPAHYQHSSTDSAVTANSTLGAPMVQMATKPKRIRMEDMVSPGLINAQLILQQSQKPQKVSSLR